MSNVNSTNDKTKEIMSKIRKASDDENKPEIFDEFLHVYRFDGFPKDYKLLTEAEMKHITNEGTELVKKVFKEKFGNELAEVKPSKNPDFVALCGAPGTGKSYMTKQIMESFGDESAFATDTDTCRIQYEHFEKISNGEQKNYKKYVNPFANRLRDMRIKVAMEKGVNIIFESVPVGESGVERLVGMIKGLEGYPKGKDSAEVKKYTASCHIAVVPGEVSYVSVINRAHSKKVAGELVQAMSVPDIVNSYDKLIGMVNCPKRLIEEKMIDKVIFGTRDGDVGKTIKIDYGPDRKKIDPAVFATICAKANKDINEAYDSCRTHYPASYVTSSLKNMHYIREDGRELVARNNEGLETLNSNFEKTDYKAVVKEGNKAGRVLAHGWVKNKTYKCGIIAARTVARIAEVTRKKCNRNKEH